MGPLPPEPATDAAQPKWTFWTLPEIVRKASRGTPSRSSRAPRSTKRPASSASIPRWPMCRENGGGLGIAGLRFGVAPTDGCRADLRCACSQASGLRTSLTIEQAFRAILQSVEPTAIDEAARPRPVLLNEINSKRCECHNRKCPWRSLPFTFPPPTAEEPRRSFEWVDESDALQGEPILQIFSEQTSHPARWAEAHSIASQNGSR
jgi:hypothetical protein